jgi:hypothetical protein
MRPFPADITKQYCYSSADTTTSVTTGHTSPVRILSRPRPHLVIAGLPAVSYPENRAASQLQ